VRLNLDLVRQVERLGPLAPGREIGLRLNPRAGAFSERTRTAARYPGPDRPTKSGIDALPGQLGRTRSCAAALGDVQIDPRGAELLFQIITKRAEHASIRIGTNLPFS
jgi:hypothetical protein